MTTERAAQSSRRRLDAIVDGATEGIATVSPDGTILTWNPAAARILGTRGRDVAGTDVVDLLPAAQRSAARHVLARAASGRRTGPVHVVVRARGSTREVRHLSVVLAPVRWGDGRTEAVAVIARDVTDLRRLQRVSSRLRSELTQAREVASVGRLVQSVAHDFNNVLTAIHGFATITASDLEGRHREDQLEIIRAAERGSDLARRLLVQARRPSAAGAAVPVDDALGACARMLRRLLPAGVELILDLEADSLVAIDPVEIDQVVMNLVLNARDAIGDAGLIVVESRRIDAPADAWHGAGARAEVIVRVSDTGRGMDAGTRDRAFEPFFTTKEAGIGTGLGLATVREIVERAGGSIHLASTPGRGTVLTVRLPASA